MDADDVVCTGFPPAPERANFAFDDCKDMAAGDECDADCAEGFDGEVTATCLSNGTFAVTGSCQPFEEDDSAGEFAQHFEDSCGASTACQTLLQVVAVMPALPRGDFGLLTSALCRQG